MLMERIVNYEYVGRIEMTKIAFLIFAKKGGKTNGATSSFNYHPIALARFSQRLFGYF